MPRSKLLFLTSWWLESTISSRVSLVEGSFFNELLGAVWLFPLNLKIETRGSVSKEPFWSHWFLYGTADSILRTSKWRHGKSSLSTPNLSNHKPYSYCDDILNVKAIWSWIWKSHAENFFHLSWLLLHLRASRCWVTQKFPRLSLSWNWTVRFSPEDSDDQRFPTLFARQHDFPKVPLM